MFIVYDLIFFIFVLIYLPIYLFKGKFHAGFLNRLGFLPRDLNLGRPIWVHAVSVGEAVAARGLIEGLRKEYPGKKFVISTVTSTGNKIGRSLVKDGDLLIYLPFDFGFIVNSVIKRINPGVFIIVETELWPNLISCLHKKKIPVIVVNGRISDGSLRGYRAIRLFIKPVLNKISLFCVQTGTDAQRLKRLGASENKIVVTGNMKFDIKINAQAQDNPLIYRQRLMLSPEDILLVAGSTHPGEEEIIIGAYKKLLCGFPDLKLLIAPRHPERSRQVSQILFKYDFFPVLISVLSGQGLADKNNPVFVLDTVGELAGFYSAADIVFVGGSLVKKGGHNILEPASFRRPVIFGEYMFNFRNIANMFLENQAAIMAPDADALVFKIEGLLKDKILAQELGDRAYNLIMKNRGATGRNIELIKQQINHWSS